MKLEDIIEQKIGEMESPGYEPPKRFGRRDYLAVALVAAGCLALILAGASLQRGPEKYEGGPLRNRADFAGARYTNVGTSSGIPLAVGKLAKCWGCLSWESINAGTIRNRP